MSSSDRPVSSSPSVPRFRVDDYQQELDHLSKLSEAGRQAEVAGSKTSEAKHKKPKARFTVKDSDEEQEVGMEAEESKEEKKKASKKNKRGSSEAADKKSTKKKKKDKDGDTTGEEEA